MASAWDRFWLYVRLVALVLLVVFAVQLFVLNINRDGPPRMLPWTDWMGGVWVLVLAFVLGALAVPLGKALVKAWRDYRADETMRRDEIAEQAVQNTLGEILQATQSSSGKHSARSAGTGRAETSGKADAADVWTSGEEQESP